MTRATLRATINTIMASVIPSMMSAAFGVSQQPRADMPALCLGQYRQARDDVSPGLVGMIGVRVEPTGRYGVILAGLNGLAA